MTNLYVQEIWDRGYERLEFEIAAPTDQVRQWLERSAKGRSGRCLEIGCFPGRYLAVMGELGFELNGIDLTPRVDPEMKTWLQDQGYRVGRIVRGDFFADHGGAKYDVVYSVGFLEHFTDWESVLRRHAELVADGGMLLLNVPNFTGWFQRFFHKAVDRENFERHHLGAMNPSAWKAEIEKQGFRVLELGYFDRLDFWVGEQKRNFAQKGLFWALRAFKPFLRPLVPRGSSSFSPYLGMIAVKES